MESINFIIHERTKHSITDRLCKQESVCNDQLFWDNEINVEFPQLWKDSLSKYVSGKELYDHLKCLQNPFRGDFHKVLTSPFWRKLNTNTFIHFRKCVNKMLSIMEYKDFYTIREYFYMTMKTCDLVVELDLKLFDEIDPLMDVFEIEERANNVIKLFLRDRAEDVYNIDGPVSNVKPDENVYVHITVIDQDRSLDNSLIMAEDPIVLEYITEMNDDLERVQTRAKDKDSLYHLLYNAKLWKKDPDYLNQTKRLIR